VFGRHYRLFYSISVTFAVALMLPFQRTTGFLIPGELNESMVVFFTNFIYKFFILIHLLHSSTCFEHYCAHLQEDYCINTVLVSSLSLGDCSVHRLQESSRTLFTEQSPKESDDTRCCVNTTVLLKMSTVVLETCRGM